MYVEKFMDFCDKLKSFYFLICNLGELKDIGLIY